MVASAHAPPRGTLRPAVTRLAAPPPASPSLRERLVGRRRSRDRGGPEDGVLVLRDVTKAYPNGKEALRDVDLVVPEGDFVFLVGPSGAGKSTLIKLLVHDEQATSGEVHVAKYDLTRSGFGHTTEKVIRGYNDGLPIEAFIHRWKTERTERYTDSDGNSHTRTVTEDHSEILTAITMPFSFPLLSVGGGWGGKKVRFESEEFNDRFTVRTDDPKFASDVIHPRTMEFLLALQPPAFRIEGTEMRFQVDKHDTQLIGLCADFSHEFFSRVPPFVWKDLQISPPAFRRMPSDQDSERSVRQGDRPDADMTERPAQ